MKRMKKISALIAAALIAAAMTACGDGESVQANATAAQTESVSHDFTYTTPSGKSYSGTYTGGWADGKPNGEGSFEGDSEKGHITLAGNWSGGQPHGQCRQTLKNDKNIRTWNVDFFYGVIQGNGDWKAEDLNGNLLRKYSGEWKDGNSNGIGEMTYYHTAEEAAENGVQRRVYKGGFSDGKWNGEAELTVYYTDELVEKYGDDYCVYTGEAKDGALTEPYRYAFYKDSEVVEQGRVRNGKFVSDGEKAFKDGIYDALRGFAGDGPVGDAFDALAPNFYDRNAE